MKTFMRRHGSVLALIIFLCTLINLVQSLERYLQYMHLGIRLKVLFGIHILILISLLVFLYRTRQNDTNVIRILIRHWKEIPAPKWAKRIILIIFSGEMAVIIAGETYYPLADVGMFRFSSPPHELPAVCIIPKYYYKDVQGAPQIVELRRQHIFFMADLLGLGYNNEYTFSASYHYKGEKSNFDFLQKALKEEAGIDSLWVGLHHVDYRTGRVWFDPDPVKAVEFNRLEKIFYGPIYIPEYQLELAVNHEH